MDNPKISGPTTAREPCWKMVSGKAFFKLSWLTYILIGIFVLVNVVLYKQSKNLLLNIFPHFTSKQVIAQDLSLLQVQTRNHTSKLQPSPPPEIISRIPHTMPQIFPDTDFETYEKRLASLNKPMFKEAIINPHNFQYVIMPNVSCAHRNIELVICVSIARQNTHGRHVIRETWGSYASSPHSNITLVFFVGSTNSSFDNEQYSDPHQTELEEESKEYGDILQEDFIDSYRNLTLKSVSILKWVSHFCPNAKFVLKADDDMYINVPLLVRSLRERASLQGTPSAFVTGTLQIGAKPLRSKSSKWYAPESDFKQKVYPTYASGTAYAMTGETAFLLYEASLRVPFFWLEDIYITGLCSLKASVMLYNNGKFSLSKLNPSGCAFKNHITGHRYSLEQIKHIHKELYDPNLKC